MRKITKIKIKYYSKEILKYLLLVGEIYTASGLPRDFPDNLKRAIAKFNKEKFANSFHYLKKRGLIEIRKEGHDVCIALTKEGRRRVGKYQIDDLEIEKPKKWDGKWRVVIFDIPNISGIVRNIFRRKLKEFGFCLIQKSIWVIPYPCQEEIDLLREFLGLSKKQIRVLEVVKLEDDKSLKEFFNLS